MQRPDPAPIGAEWQNSSTIWGRSAGTGQWVEQTSPADGRLIQRARFIGPDEISALLQPHPNTDQVSPEAVRAFCTRLHDELLALYPDILEATRLETAFIGSDCEEMAQGVLDYVAGFPEYFAGLPDKEYPSLGYQDALGPRRIRLADVPWGTVAVILPQNAFMYLAVTCLLNALATGNRVILRAPAQSARSAGLLSLAVQRAQAPSDAVSIIMVSARTFLNSVYESAEPILVHYLGSSAHAPDILSNCFKSGKQALIDGEGNAWIYVDREVPIEYASDILTSGALRYNGQTCTSINGAVIHPDIYKALREHLTARWNTLRFGNPLDSDVQVGPLMDESQAEHCLSQIAASGGTILAGGHRSGNLLTPTLVADPSPGSTLVSDGLFGCALWIAPGDLSMFAQLWPRNHYPLCAGMLSQARSGDYLHRLPNVARLTINGDPSVEYMYEPWGGYPASGTNPVSDWRRKYVRAIQVDSPV